MLPYRKCTCPRRYSLSISYRYTRFYLFWTLWPQVRWAVLKNEKNQHMNESRSVIFICKNDIFSFGFCKSSVRCFRSCSRVVSAFFIRKRRRDRRNNDRKKSHNTGRVQDLFGIILFRVSHSQDSSFSWSPNPLGPCSVMGEPSTKWTWNNSNCKKNKNK